jgi:hypothetical protein
MLTFDLNTNGDIEAAILRLTMASTGSGELDVLVGKFFGAPYDRAPPDAVFETYYDDGTSSWRTPVYEEIRAKRDSFENLDDFFAYEEKMVEEHGPHLGSVPAYTRSLDAITKLIRDYDFVYSIDTDYGGWVSSSVSCSPEGPFWDSTKTDNAATEPLALCIALLKALAIRIEWMRTGGGYAV